MRGLPPCPNGAQHCSPGLARAAAALVAFQQGRGDQAELELRALIRRYPLLAEARAALAALLCSRGALGEASGSGGRPPGWIRAMASASGCWRAAAGRRGR
jgi:hypothetical protein